jgi:hypothetical protein
MEAVVHPARVNNKAGRVVFVIAASGNEVTFYERLPAGSIRLSNDEKTCPLRCTRVKPFMAFDS